MTAASLVVIVEDDPASRRTLSRVLRAGGYDSAAYASAEEYLASPPAGVPLGLLLDIHLEGMSGLDLQRRIRASGSTVPIILITAHGDSRARAEAQRFGCTAFLRKPCEAETILSILKSLPRVTKVE
jgi:FixJ family two-component response regulator